MAALLLVGALASCSKQAEIEAPTQEPETGEIQEEKQEIKFNITVADINPETKAMKKDWATGDKLSVWFMFDQQQEPDLVLTYDGTKWEAGTLRSGVTAEDLAEAVDDYSNYAYCYYEGFNDLSKYSYVKDKYGMKFYCTTELGGTTYPQLPMVLFGGALYAFDKVTNTLSATLGAGDADEGVDAWKYITNLQVVITGLAGEPGKYTLACDQLNSPAYFDLDGVGDILNTQHVVAGVSNDDGVAFNFWLTDGGAADPTFTLTDYTDESNPVVKTYTATGKSLTSPGIKKCIGIKIDGSKFQEEPAQLWSGGPYWAKTNLGAVSETGYGYYYAWGYTKGCVRNSAGDGWVLASDGTTEEQFNTTGFPYLSPESGYVLEAAKDAATAHLGTGWRMPTKEDFDNLKSNCEVEYVTSGVCGVRFTGKGDYAGNSIFLPAAGYGEGSYLQVPGATGCYWSSTQDVSYKANYLLFNPSFGSYFVGYDGNKDDRCCGYSVRPVRDTL